VTIDCPAVGVDPLGIEIDAKVAEYRGTQIGRRYSSLLDLATPGVSAADDLAMGQTAAC